MDRAREDRYVKIVSLNQTGKHYRAKVQDKLTRRRHGSASRAIEYRGRLLDRLGRFEALAAAQARALDERTTEIVGG